MPQKVYMLCGVPGSGKSWVASGLPEYTYVSHDAHKTGYVDKIAEAAASSDKPILADCPFAERELRSQLEKRGLVVEPKFIVEHPLVVKQRYEAREGKPVSKSTLTRARTIVEKADEWAAYRGTAEQVKEHLKKYAK